VDLKLQDKRCLVTGASTGIGVGIARALAREGVRLALTARRAELLEQVASDIERDTGHRPLVVADDLTDPLSVERIHAQVMRHCGGIDILVNNAGGSRPFKQLHVPESSWVEAMALNFERPRQLAEAFIDDMMARQWGRIINITGKSEPDHVNGAFCAKAGIHSWAKGLSRMVGPHGITVNCIPPGRIHSEQIFRNYTPEYRQWQCENEIPMGRYGEPEDMANLVTFLSSPLASYITGAVIPVDGGLRRYQF
jgi:3-oxoacyl-[acyl-carrier protein] reductase